MGRHYHLNPTKTQLAALPSTVILAGQGAGGAIKAGPRMNLAQGGNEPGGGCRAVAKFYRASNAIDESDLSRSWTRKPQILCAILSRLTRPGEWRSIISPRAERLDLGVAGGAAQFRSPSHDGATLSALARVCARGIDGRIPGRIRCARRR